jgi:hypothetical protein
VRRKAKIQIKAIRSASSKERLRRRYRPERVKLLFIGEAPPASGHFFYQADSGLYRAVRSTFIAVFPKLTNEDFLKSFRTFGCYLVDLCGTPVDRLNKSQRRKVCKDGEARLSRTIQNLRPKIVITIVRSIENNVARAMIRARRNESSLNLPYPGRWKKHRMEFEKILAPVLRKELKLPI